MCISFVHFSHSLFSFLLNIIITLFLSGSIVSLCLSLIAWYLAFQLGPENQKAMKRTMEAMIIKMKIAISTQNSFECFIALQYDPALSSNSVSECVSIICIFGPFLSKFENIRFSKYSEVLIALNNQK